MNNYNQFKEIDFNFGTFTVRHMPFFSNPPSLFIIKINWKMGKTAKTETKTVKDPQDHPISKKRTLLTNLNAYIRMLKQNFSDMSSRQYIKNVHRFIDKIKRKLKFTDQQKLVEARQKIKICTKCEGWSSNKTFLQCNLCEDYYHESCIRKNLSDE